MADRPRILVLGEAGAAATEWLRRWPEAESVAADSLASALEMIGKEHFDAVLANPGDKAILNTTRHLLESQRILAAVPDGLALVDFDLKIRWANPAFRAWCRGEVVDRGFYDALGSPELSGPDYCPFQSALANLGALRASGSTAAPVALSACLACRNGRYHRPSRHAA